MQIVFFCRNKVIRICYQDNIELFSKQFPERNFENYSYIDSGSYSSVVKCFNKELNRECVLKLIKLKHCKQMTKDIKEMKVSIQKQSTRRNSCEEKLQCEPYHGVFQEIVISNALSNLHSVICNSQMYEFRAHCFPKVFKTSLVCGNIPLSGQTNIFTINGWSDVSVLMCSVLAALSTN